MNFNESVKLSVFKIPFLGKEFQVVSRYCWQRINQENHACKCFLKNSILYITISKYALLWFQHITEIGCAENEVSITKRRKWERRGQGIHFWGSISFHKETTAPFWKLREKKFQFHLAKTYSEIISRFFLRIPNLELDYSLQLRTKLLCIRKHTKRLIWKSYPTVFSTGWITNEENTRNNVPEFLYIWRLNTRNSIIALGAKHRFSWNWACYLRSTFSFLDSPTVNGFNCRFKGMESVLPPPKLAQQSPIFCNIFYCKLYTYFSYRKNCGSSERILLLGCK